MQNDDSERPKGNGRSARRAIAYIVLIFIDFLCLFWFYVLFINATRSNGEINRGFTPIPSTHPCYKLYNVFHGTLPIERACSTVLSSRLQCGTLYLFFDHDRVCDPCV